MTYFKDLVILLPGITGSVLVNASGKEVWAPTVGTVWRALTGHAIEGLELTGDTDDGVTATRLVPDTTIVPGLVKIDGYTRIQQVLCTGLGLEEGRNFRAFPYDWRQDNARTAQRLASCAMDWLKTWREASSPDAKLVLIGHSMGGLVARYFVECLGGWQHTRTLLTLATPHRGALNAVGFLENGMKKKIGPFGLDLSPMLRSLPSVYQLLPTYPCIDAGAGLLRVAQAAQAGVLRQVDAARATAARSFHQKITDAQAANARDEAYLHSGYAMRPVVGTDQPTAQSARMDNGQCVLVNSLGGEDLGGDGTVPFASATPIDLEGAQREVYAAESHGAIQNNDGTLANIKGTLTNNQIEWRRFQRASDLAVLTLELDDVVLPGDALGLRVRPSEGQPPLTVTLTPLAGGTSFVEPLVRDAQAGWQRGSFNLPPGGWRVQVHGPGVAPVSELAVVAAA